MYNKITLIFISIFAFNSCFAQTDNILGSKYGLRGDTLKRDFKMLFLIKDSNTTRISENLIIGPNEVDSAFTLSYKSSLEVCQQIDVSAILVLKPKPYVKLVTLIEIFNIYNVQKSDQNL